MLSYSELQVLDAIERTQSFSGAAKILHKVPSAISYTVRQLESQLSVKLFEREHHRVVATPAGKYVIQQARELIEQMDQLPLQSQRIANGWNDSIAIVFDNILPMAPQLELIDALNQQFPQVQVEISYEVYNGVWDALSDGRADLAIGATSAMPIAGDYGYRDMGSFNWVFVVARNHPLARESGVLEDDRVAQYPALCLEDTSRHLAKRYNWSLPNQRRILLPDWQMAVKCLRRGTGVMQLPHYLAAPWLANGELVARQLAQPNQDAPQCIAWNKNAAGPVLDWLLQYLGDPHQLNRVWLSAPDH